MPFVNDARLLIRPGMTGATGNLYTGLHEFADMAFVMHVLRPEDLFVDVGANVGSYTVLAGKGVGARCLAAEPVAATFRALQDNINLNDLRTRVNAQQVAVGRAAGTVRMTSGLDAENHVAPEGASASHGATEEVAVTTLDALLEAETEAAGAEAVPRLLKIDVEGFESEVLAGASRTLEHARLQAILMETNGTATLYGKDERNNHRLLLSLGFETYDYEPQSRQLRALDGAYHPHGNTLYLRDAAALQQRLREAPRFSVLGRTL